MHAGCEVQPKVHIILLNWNGWRDTIECLESVLRLNYSNFQVVVCDNASTDGSLERIEAWAAGNLPASCECEQLRSLSSPPLPKPIPVAHVEYAPEAFAKTVQAPLVLIQTGANRGFAGGCNVGLAFSLAQGGNYAWLLNNDTVVHRDALSQLVIRMKQRPDAGFCGSTLLYYRDPQRVQAWGGAIYNKWLARGTHLGEGRVCAELPSAESVERQMSYVVGASMLVRSSLMQEIGLMNEQYFLYFEEIDWATRAKGRYTPAYAPGSFVFHKEGGSIGSSADRKKRSLLSERYTSRNRMFFSISYESVVCQGVVFGVLLLTAFSRLLCGNILAARTIIAAMLRTVFCPTKDNLPMDMNRGRTSSAS